MTDTRLQTHERKAINDVVAVTGAQSAVQLFGVEMAQLWKAAAGGSVKRITVQRIRDRIRAARTQSAA